MSWIQLVSSLLLLPLTTLAPDDADDLVQYIDGLFDRGLHDMVADEARDFLGDHRGHPQEDRVRYRLATSLFELDRLDEAAPEFRTLLRDDDFAYRAEAALRLGQCEMAAGDLEAAGDALRQAMARDYLQLPATFLLAECDFRSGRFAEAAPRYERVLREDDEGTYSRDAAAALAWCAYRTGQYEQAASRADAVIAGGPGEELTWEMRFVQGESWLEAQRPADARAAYEGVEGGAFEDAALRGAGFAAAAQGDHAAAAMAFQQLLTRHPESRFADEARLQLGIQRLQAGDAEGAERALSADGLPEDAETLYWRARAQSEAGSPQAALATLDRALASNPPQELAPHLHTAKGDVLTKLGQGGAAAAAYEASGSTAARHAAAVTRLNAGEAAEALRLVEPLVERPDADSSVHLTHAEALFALDRWEAAEPVFQRARQGAAEAETRRIDSRLAWCRYLRDDLDTAAQRFDALAARAPNSNEGREALFMVGRCQQTQGREAEAAAAWRRYVRLEPPGERRPEALLALAELEPPEDARRHLEMLLTTDPDPALAAPALLSLAELLEAQGETQGAEARYALLLENYPASTEAPSARYGLAYRQVERGAHDEAVTTLQPLAWPNGRPGAQRAADGTPVAHASTRGQPADAAGDPALRVAALELLVWCHHERGDPQAAETCWRALEEAQVEDERLVASARTVASAWRAAGQPDKALDLLDEVSTRGGSGQGALVEGAWIALEEGAPDVAAERVELALSAGPADAALAEASFFVAEAFFAAGDDERALPFYRTAADTEGSPLPDEALYKMGFAHLRRGEPEPARDCFARLVSEHPGSELRGEALFLQGEAAYQLADYDGAVAPLSQVLSEQPGHQVAPKARFRLGLSLAELERWDEAEGQLTRLAQDVPDFPNLAEAELCRGRCLAAQRLERAARAAYERVIDMDEGVLAARARIGLGRMRLDADDPEEALSDFLKVVLLYAHDEEVSEAMFLAGRCLEQMGETNRARDQYRELVNDHPDSAFAERARTRLQAL